MIDTDKYEGHTEGSWKWLKDSLLLKGKAYATNRDAYCDSFIISHRHLDGDWPIDNKANAQLIADAPLLLEEVKRLHKNKFNLFTTIEQKLNEKGDEGEAIWEANPNGHYKEDELRGWCEALEFVLNLMKAQEREE